MIQGYKAIVSVVNQLLTQPANFFLDPLPFFTTRSVAKGYNCYERRDCYIDLTMSRWI